MARTQGRKRAGLAGIVGVLSLGTSALGEPSSPPPPPPTRAATPTGANSPEERRAELRRGLDRLMSELDERRAKAKTSIDLLDSGADMEKVRAALPDGMRMLLMAERNGRGLPGRGGGGPEGRGGPREGRAGPGRPEGPGGPGPGGAGGPGGPGGDSQMRYLIGDGIDEELAMAIGMSAPEHPGPPGRDGEAGGRGLTDEDRSEVRAFLKETAPGIGERLARLEKMEPGLADERLAHALPRVRLLRELKKQAPELYELRIEDLKLAQKAMENASWLVRNEEGTKAEVDEHRAALRAALERQYDVRGEIRSKELLLRNKAKAPLIDRLMEQMLKRERERPRPEREGRGRGPEDRPPPGPGPR